MRHAGHCNKLSINQHMYRLRLDNSAIRRAFMYHFAHMTRCRSAKIRAWATEISNNLSDILVRYFISDSKRFTDLLGRTTWRHRSEQSRSYTTDLISDPVRTERLRLHNYGGGKNRFRRTREVCGKSRTILFTRCYANFSAVGRNNLFCNKKP